MGADIKGQAEQVFHNLGVVLEQAGASFNHVVKFTTFLVNAEDVGPFCEKRRELFAGLRFSANRPKAACTVATETRRAYSRISEGPGKVGQLPWVPQKVTRILSGLGTYLRAVRGTARLGRR